VSEIRRSAILLVIAAGAAGAHEFSGAHGTVVIDWPTPHVRRVLSSGYGDSFGTEAWARRGFPEQVEVEGRQCVRGTWFLFDVDDEFAFDIDEPVTLELTFDRQQSAGLFVSWDQNVVAENIRRIDFPATDTRLHTQTIVLDRARFANRGESGSDFTIAAPDGTWFGDPDADHKIVLCGLTIARSYETPATEGHGKLLLSVVDEGGRPTTARIGLYDASGRLPLPSSSALTIGNYDDRTKQLFLRRTHGTVPPWPHENRWFFYADGRYEASLPAGRYKLVASKGPEYRIVTATIEVVADVESEATIGLRRWTSMPERGWYSGDDHVHMTRLPADNATIAAIMSAEDVHVTNLLQMGNPFDTHFTQYAFGPEGRYRDGRRALVPGVEDPRTAVRGHTISLNIREPYRPADRYLRYDEVFTEYRRQGGMSGFAHVAGRLFNVERGLAIDVPLGAVDFIEVLQDGILETDLWYDFLNLGMSLVPTAGSDFPYLSAPGGERNYVRVDEAFDVDAWYAALRRQQTFVTNGPMLELSVNGRNMGAVLELEPGDRIDVEAGAALNPDIERLARLELVVQGEVVASADDATADNTLALRHSLTAGSGTWIAVRASGAAQTVAHSAPVYVTTGGGFEKASAVPEIARRMMAKLAEFDTVAADPAQELEAWSVGEPLGRMLVEQRAAILERAGEARAVYARMLDRP